MKNDNIFYLSKGFEREKFLRYLWGEFRSGFLRVDKNEAEIICL